MEQQESFDDLTVDEVVEGDTDNEEVEVVPVQYSISSYGVDYTVDGLVKRLNRGDIFMPPFQRDYVWNIAEASKLIESCLLGLPIPGVFLAKETGSNKLLIIDGQQRLRTLQFFCTGVFNPKEDDAVTRNFLLTKVQKKFDGLTYNKLTENDRIKLDDTVIHATIIKQESPQDDNTSIYHVFERLNSGGKRLSPQEIRTAAYHGNFNDMIRALNNYPRWRSLYGDKSSRLKDEELILRFFAVFFDFSNYQSPMTEFLTKFNKKHKDTNEKFILNCSQLFKQTCDTIYRALGREAFRPYGRALNVAACESVMYAVAKAINEESKKDDKDIRQVNIEKLQSAHQSLFHDEKYLESITKATSNETWFNQRHNLTAQYFSDLL